ncbi:hypothetical protein Tco_1093943 [Tanacetum coccineum]|uniref:Uncharacterized protein n=1 Tax=Tanacetum coccineum TaxID=301880 RepID=A0ABQ5IEN7_9ASTR
MDDVGLHSMNQKRQHVPLQRTRSINSRLVLWSSSDGRDSLWSDGAAVAVSLGVGESSSSVVSRSSWQLPLQTTYGSLGSLWIPWEHRLEYIGFAGQDLQEQGRYGCSFTSASASTSLSSSAQPQTLASASDLRLCSLVEGGKVGPPPDKGVSILGRPFVHQLPFLLLLPPHFRIFFGSSPLPPFWVLSSTLPLCYLVLLAANANLYCLG